VHLTHVIARFLAIQLIVRVLNIRYLPLVTWKLSSIERSTLSHLFGTIAHEGVLVRMQESLRSSPRDLAGCSHRPSPQWFRASDWARVVGAPAFVARSKGHVAVSDVNLKRGSAEKKMNGKTTQRRTGPSSVELPDKFVAPPCSSCFLEGPELLGARCESLVERVQHRWRDLALHFSKTSLSKLHESSSFARVKWADFLAERLLQTIRVWKNMRRRNAGRC